MVRAKSDVLAALGSEPVLRACVGASRNIPIIFVANNYDPIARGYVQSLAKPGGNVTGVFLRQTELAEKQVELLTQAFPDRTRVAMLWDAISADQFAAAERRAKLMGLEVHSRRLDNPPYNFDAAIQTALDAKSNMLLVLSSPFFGRQREQIAELSVRQFAQWHLGGGDRQQLSRCRLRPARHCGWDEMLMQDAAGNFEVYQHNASLNAFVGNAMGAVGAPWVVNGIAANSPSTTGTSTAQLVQAMAGFGGGSGAGEGLNTAPLSAETSQQPLLTTPQHA
jgi:hypothetical protein